MERKRKKRGIFNFCLLRHNEKIKIIHDNSDLLLCRMQFHPQQRNFFIKNTYHIITYFSEEFNQFFQKNNLHSILFTFSSKTAVHKRLFYTYKLKTAFYFRKKVLFFIDFLRKIMYNII